MRQALQITLVFLACLWGTASNNVQGKDSLEMIEGTVISAKAGTLVVIDERHRAHTHAVDSSTQVMVEGKMAHLEDVRTGMDAHVTLDAGKVIAVSATKPSRQDAFMR
jgi:hypothetical protein